MPRLPIDPKELRPDQMPRLERSELPRPGIGIVHLGLGAFFRAHGAIYIEEAMAKSGGDWGIVGVSLRSPATRDALSPQGCAYFAVEKKPGGDSYQRIEVVQDALVAPEDPARVLDLMADPAVKIVTLTVTEKGYCHNPASGRLNFEHPDIRHDIEQPLPRSAPGYLVRALALRYAAGHRPFTVLTCDNLPQNGALVRDLVQELAARIDPALGEWINQEGRFPSTMVDRIAPATSPEDIEAVAEQTGLFDAAPVVHEPFRQWVIADDFVGDAKPDLGAVGVSLVDDVMPFEDMKLRCLNGTHSSLAYLGYLAGFETIADTVADGAFGQYVKRLWAHEILPVLTPPLGVDFNAYADALFERYSNPAIRHRTWQIAMDGSQKLPQRILGTLEENLAANRDAPGLMLAVAAWMRYVGGIDEQRDPIDVRDPLAEKLRSVSDAVVGVDKARALLGVREVFPEDLATALVPGVSTAYERLLSLGARRAVEELT